jgi:hypothetical protein
MNRLRRFYEKVPYGQTSSRVAYVTNTATLPESSPDAEWAEDETFNAGDAILASVAEGSLQAGYSQRLSI